MAAFSGLTTNLGLVPFANITTVLPSPKKPILKSFTPKKIFLGCAINTSPGNQLPVKVSTAPSAPLPQACGVTFKGVNLKTNMAVEQTCQYSGSELNPGLQECIFDEEKFGGGVQTLVLSVESAFLMKESASVYLDDLVHVDFF